jgi:hypothetical protein
MPHAKDAKGAKVEKGIFLCGLGELCVRQLTSGPFSLTSILSRWERRAARAGSKGRDGGGRSDADEVAPSPSGRRRGEGERNRKLGAMTSAIGATASSPGRQPGVSGQDDKAPEGRQSALPPLRGLLAFPPKPRADARGYYLTALRA